MTWKRKDGAEVPGLAFGERELRGSAADGERKKSMVCTHVAHFAASTSETRIDIYIYELGADAFLRSCLKRGELQPGNRASCASRSGGASSPR